MTVAEWLERRSPQPPEALRARMAFRLGESGEADAASATERCTSAAVRTIHALVTGDGRSRDHAIDLLAADALITYAVEASADNAGDLASRMDAMVRELSSIAVRE